MIKERKNKTERIYNQLKIYIDLTKQGGGFFLAALFRKLINIHI